MAVAVYSFSVSLVLSGLLEEPQRCNVFRISLTEGFAFFFPFLVAFFFFAIFFLDFDFRRDLAFDFPRLRTFPPRFMVARFDFFARFVVGFVHSVISPAKRFLTILFFFR